MRRVKLGDVEFDVITSESPKDSATVTDKPVESGQDISDHVKQNSSIINIRGQMTEDAADKLQILKRYQKDGELLKYVGRNIYSNMVIEEIDREHGVDNRNGFQFNIKLKQVRIATAKEVEIKVANPNTGKQDKKTVTKVKPVTNKGKQQPKQKRVADNQTKVMNHGMIAMMR
ncbi:MAG TPA: hypothetical protein VK982_05985 [Bacteroidales bacterium]|nr:hypothetical protein [Bacteroidales bacterium]